jgi:hypothetical protein
MWRGNSSFALPLEIYCQVNERSLSQFMEVARHAAADKRARVVPVWRESLLDSAAL